MSAVISDTTRKILGDLLLKEVIDATDSDQYYIGIGHSETYNSTDTTITPTRTRALERDIRNKLQSVKKVEAVSFVIDRHNWASGGIYNAYDDDVVGTSYGNPSRPYYVLTEDNDVFLCVQQSKSNTGQVQTSVIKPAVPGGADRNRPFELGDGYAWKYLFSLSAAQTNSFLSANFMPIEKVEKDSGNCNIFELAQLNVQNSAVKGQVVGIEVINGGSGYTSAPAVTIRGSGTGAVATATIDGGVVTKIEMNNFDSDLGSGYDAADIIIAAPSSGTTATARAIVSPINGLGFDARDDLKAGSVMFNIQPIGAENNDFLVDQSFRQISLIKNINTPAGVRYTSSTGNALRSMKSASSNSLTKSRVMSDGGSPEVKAHIDMITDSSIFYHQNDSTGFGAFDSGATTITDGIGTISIDSAAIPGDVDPFSGDILYMENRARVVRDATQTEDIKVIITV